MAKGRKTGGRVKGAKNKRTLQRAVVADAELDVLRRFIRKELMPMARAQAAQAKGIKYLVVREKKTGKFLRVGEAMARVKLADGEELVEVWEKDPSTHAFAELLNRTYGKAAEQPQEVTVTGAIDVVEILKTRIQQRKRRTDA